MATRELICIVDPIHPDAHAAIAAAYDVIGPDEWQGHARLGDVTILVVRTSIVDDGLLARMGSLRAVVKHGAGVDNIAIPAATARGILVANTPGGNNSTAVAEGAVAAMLALLRRVRDMDLLVRKGRWDERWDIRLGDLTGARVGLVGFGRIARVVARICGAGFGAEVIAHDPHLPPEMIDAAGARPAELAEVLACDIVSIHTPLTEGTRDLIDTLELAMMKPHAILVNCSRGGIVNEAALAEALRSGQIAGAAIDVLEREPPPHDHPLLDLPNCLLSPHVAGITEAGMRDMGDNVVRVIEMIAHGEVPPSLLNPEAMAGEHP